jgi:hypothetical protein
MKRASIFVLAIGFCAVAYGGPQTKITSVSPKYPSGEIEITWETALTGGCTTSSVALTNNGAANHQALVATLLAAVSMQATVEVTWGGGCGASNTNWIHTIRLIAP